MINHIAVILRGHIRTWRIIHPFVFDFYEKISNHVDYYAISWNGSQNNTDVYGSFKNKNLISLEYHQPTENFSTSYNAASYLSYMMLPYKHKREKYVKYDAVFDSRFDVLPILYDHIPILSPEQNTWYTTGYELHHNFRYNAFDIAIHDWFFVSDSKVHDKMSERFIENNDQGNQITVRTFAEDNNFFVNRIPYANAVMTRPNIADAITDGVIDYDRVNQLHNEWYFLSSEQKIDRLEKEYISIMDYDTGSATCAI